MGAGARKLNKQHYGTTQKERIGEARNGAAWNNGNTGRARHLEWLAIRGVDGDALERGAA